MGKTKRGKKDSSDRTRKEKDNYDEEDVPDRFDTSKPQFRQPKKESTKVVLDDRFASVLTDPRFQVQEKDKYGRHARSKRKLVSRQREALEEFYTIEANGVDKSKNSVDREGAESSSRDDDESPDSYKNNRSNENEATIESQSDSESSSDQQDDPASRIAYLTAFSRGQLDLSSSSEESDDDSHSSSSSEEENDASVHKDTVGILDPSSIEQEQRKIELTDASSPYLAVLNMDWAHVRAVDIFAILSSFSLPGSVKSVRIYPSDYGLERMEKEEKFGPSDVWAPKEQSDIEKGEFSEEGNPEDGDDDDEQSEQSFTEDLEEDRVDSGFDPEKLRAYEASKLKYYFAIAEFANPRVADATYKEVDGLEFEHSSAAIDLRVIPTSEIQSVIEGRSEKDAATSIPSNYVPPEFIVEALQQTDVQCSWELGDRDRERTLTKYTSGETWRSLADSDDIKVYLASDVSSDDNEDSEDEKVVNKRKLLGLDSDDDVDEGVTDVNDDPFFADADHDGKAESSVEEGSSGDSSDDDRGKETTFVPGQNKTAQLEQKIRQSLKAKAETEALTPWEKYQEKRKQKRRERRQAARRLRKDQITTNVEALDEDSGDAKMLKQSKEDLELLIAGDDRDEEARDFDMRGLQRLEQNKDKKLRGSRKRKEEERTADIAGKEFQIDTKDDRFAALLDGQDSRFGIDRTDPNFKETAGMRDILAEQSRRRKSKKRRKTTNAKGGTDTVPDVSAESNSPSLGASALSALVNSIKSKVK